MDKELRYCQVKVHKEQQEYEFKVRRGLGFQALGATSANPIEFDCRDADCGICVVRVLKGKEHLSPLQDKEKDFLQAMRAEADERLACQCRVFGDIEVVVEY